MKKSISFILLFLMTLCVFGQKNILIIPFDAKMYNNQESKAICEYSGVSYDKSIEKIRTDLDMHIYSALKDSMNVSSMLRTYTTDASTDMEVVHDNSVYYQSDKVVDDIDKPSKKSGAPNSSIITPPPDSTRYGRPNRCRSCSMPALKRARTPRRTSRRTGCPPCGGR